jgi:hypothetical protein
MGGANIQIVHYFDHSYLEEEKSMIHSFTVTFGVKYLTGMAILCAFGIQVWEFAFCYIMWI